MSNIELKRSNSKRQRFMKSLLVQSSQDVEQTVQIEESRDLNDSQSMEGKDVTKTESFPIRTIILISSIILNLILLILLISVIVILHTDKCKQNDSSLGTYTKYENLTIAKELSGAKIRCFSEEFECQRYGSTGKEDLMSSTKNSKN